MLAGETQEGRAVQEHRGSETRAEYHTTRKVCLEEVWSKLKETSLSQYKFEGNGRQTKSWRLWAQANTVPEKASREKQGANEGFIQEPIRPFLRKLGTWRTWPRSLKSYPRGQTY